MAVDMALIWSLLCEYVEVDYHFVLRAVCKDAAACIPRGRTRPSKLVSDDRLEWLPKETLRGPQTLLALVRADDLAGCKRLIPYLKEDHLPDHEELEDAVIVRASEALLRLLQRHLLVKVRAAICWKWRATGILHISDFADTAVDDVFVMGKYQHYIKLIEIEMPPGGMTGVA